MSRKLSKPVRARRMKRIEKLEARRAELIAYAKAARKGHKTTAREELRRITTEALKAEMRV